MTKDKKLDDNNIKDVSLLTPKTYDYHRKKNKQTEILNGLQRELISFRMQLVISYIFNGGKINAIAAE